eukprot:7762260-Pyramimonas_sp.AAC.1
MPLELSQTVRGIVAAEGAHQRRGILNRGDFQRRPIGNASPMDSCALQVLLGTRHRLKPRPTCRTLVSHDRESSGVSNTMTLHL